MSGEILRASVIGLLVEHRNEIEDFVNVAILIVAWKVCRWGMSRFAWLGCMGVGVSKRQPTGWA